MHGLQGKRGDGLFELFEQLNPVDITARFEDPDEMVATFEKQVYTYEFTLSGLEEAITNAMQFIYMRMHLGWSEEKEKITLFIPQLVQIAICHLFHKERLSYQHNAPIGQGINELFGFKVEQGYESNVIIVHVKDSEIKGFPPLRINCNVTKKSNVDKGK